MVYPFALFFAKIKKLNYLIIFGPIFDKGSTNLIFHGEINGRHIGSPMPGDAVNTRGDATTDFVWRFFTIFAP